MKVLLVDDSPMVRERLEAMLGDIPDVDTIGQAGGSVEAINSFRNLNPDVVILDIQMPDGNGIGVLEKLRKAEQPPMVIVLTNQSYPQYRRKCMEAGADFFFDKSTEFDKVAEILKKSK